MVIEMRRMFAGMHFSTCSTVKYFFAKLSAKAGRTKEAQALIWDNVQEMAGAAEKIWVLWQLLLERQELKFD